MADNSPPNSFFSLVTGKQNAAAENAEKGHEEHAVVDAEVAATAPMEKCAAQSSELGDTTEAGAAGETTSQHDTGMPHDARRVLVHLMRQGSVMASQKSKLFELLCRHESAIRKHLSEVYLQLVLDQKTGVAFVASADYETERAENDTESGAESEEDLALDESTTLIPKRTLSLYDTLILLVLRKHYQDRESAGEQKITIDIERLESYLTPFLPITDHASKDRKKLIARVKEMVKRKLLSTIRGAEDRYEITPIIRYVVSASFLESLLTEYKTLASEQLNHGEGAGDEHEQS